MADDRCRSKITHESGVVLQCMEPRGHAGNHLTTREQWGDHHPDEIVESTGAHVYLSTGCLHGDHDYCQRVVGSWHKQPAQCKFCAAPCVCLCHEIGYATPASAGEPKATSKDRQIEEDR